MAAHQDQEDAAGLLNDLWQRQQQKVFYITLLVGLHTQAFTAWVNSHLRKVGEKCENIQTDLRFAVSSRLR